MVHRNQKGAIALIRREAFTKDASKPSHDSVLIGRDSETERICITAATLV